ncbi:hypothetical protein [Streptomyces sp. NPDC016845]|uniref:hypothetical protein n=1 Tax=Streptomyces sp. NPDC016845 TaxID=3364972 RepID=UPI0037AAC202
MTHPPTPPPGTGPGRKPGPDPAPPPGKAPAPGPSLPGSSPPGSSPSGSPSGSSLPESPPPGSLPGSSLPESPPPGSLPGSPPSGSLTESSSPGSPPPGSPCGSPPPDIADAITALTTFLRNGSQARDPEAFSPAQLNIERDFRDLLTGLGRGSSDPPERMVRPVLSHGLVELGAPLPAEAFSIGGFNRFGRRSNKVWLVKVAEASKSPGDPTHLRHDHIVVDSVVRLRVFDESGRRILTGVPRIAKAKAPSRPTP